MSCIKSKQFNVFHDVKETSKTKMNFFKYLDATYLATYWLTVCMERLTALLFNATAVCDAVSPTNQCYFKAVVSFVAATAVAG